MSIIELTTTDIAEELNMANLYANKPKEKATAYIYMVPTNSPIVGSHKWYLDKILNVAFYFIAAETPGSWTTSEEELNSAIVLMSNLIVSNDQRDYNWKVVYKVEEWTDTPVLYNDKNKPLKIKNYLFYYSSKNG